MRDSNIPIYDITPLMAINDNDALVFGGFVMLLALIIASIVVWAVRKIKSRPLTITQTRIQQWNAISMDDSKKAAYKMSQLGRFFAQENGEIRTLFDRLEDELTQYKYAKNVEPLSEAILQLYRDISVRIR